MKVGVLFSGGKDSSLALYRFVKEGGKADVLLSMIPETKDSFMFHKPDLGLLKKQAEMLGKKLILEKTKGKKDKELKDLKKLIKKSKIKKLVIGGIKSSYQGNRIKKICSDLGVNVVAPLWNYNVEKLWKELILIIHDLPDTQENYLVFRREFSEKQNQALKVFSSLN